MAKIRTREDYIKHDGDDEDENKLTIDDLFVMPEDAKEVNKRNKALGFEETSNTSNE